MASGLLSLKWNHHRSTFLHVLANIRQKESYCDVTLACAGKFYSAHKLVLSTCSEYFEEMFERTQCKHPVIVLKDIGADELEALLSYMYDGEVNVLQEHLSSLIKAAECLKIKGLAVADSDPTEHSGGKSSSKDKSSSGSGGGGGISSNSKDVHRSHNSTSNSNTHSNSFQSDSSSRQFRNSSGSGGGGGVKRPSLSSKLEDGPSKRRRPEPSSPARRHSSERPSSVPRGGAAAEGKDGGDDGASDGGDGGRGGDDGGNGMDRPPSPADDQQTEDGGDDTQSFAEGLSEQTGVKAEPVEIIDSDDMAGFDHQAGDGGSHDASDAEFTEEKFAGGSAEANDPSLWGGGANNDMFSQPSTSSFTGQDGSNSNDNNTSGGGKGGGSSILWESTVSPPAPSATPTTAPTTTAATTITCTPSVASAASSTTVNNATTMVYLSHEEAQNALDWIPKMEKMEHGVHVQFQPAGPTAQPVSGGDLHQFLDTHMNPAQQHLQQLPMPHQQHLSPDKLQGGYPSFVKYQQELPPDSFRVAITEGPANLQGGPTTSGAPTIKGKTFYCNLCEYSTALFGNLKTHFRQHTKEKPFACHLCDYKARQQSNLKTHMRKHTGEKPYACEFCDYKSSQHSNLKIHRMLHTGERPFECPICYKKFSRHGYFHSHYTLHPEHHLRPCPYCQV